VDNGELRARIGEARYPGESTMRQLSLISALVLLAPAIRVVADEPIPVSQPVPPTLMMASATASCCNGVNLRIQTVQFTQAVQEVKVKVPVTEKTWHKGKWVEHTRTVEQRQLMTVLQPIPAAVVEVPIDGAIVSVCELKGNPVSPSKVAQMLKKETAVLVSMSGPIDPYYLQTTKPGTLIVHVPANMLYPTTTVASPAAAPPTELVPASGTTIDPGEPPLAPPKPKKN
jgi:hypothetical protein